MSSGRLKRRKLNVDELALDYDSCEEVRCWEFENYYTGETVRPPEPEVDYRDYCWDRSIKRTEWLRALRGLHKDLLHRSVERARVARTPKASDKHQEAAEAVRIRWQTVVQQVNKKCLALPLQAQWPRSCWQDPEPPLCLRGWYDAETVPPPHLVALLPDETLYRE